MSLFAGSNTGECMIRKIKCAIAGFLCAALIGLGAATQGQVLELGNVLNGTAPTSTYPWITATFTTLFPGTVTLTLASHLNVASEFIGEIGLNLKPDISPASLLFSQSSGPGFSSINQPANQDAVKLTGGGSLGDGLDLAIDWPGGGTLQRFDANDIVTFTISGPPTLVAEDFNYYNNIGVQPGPIIVGAHIQGIPTGGGSTASAALMQTIPEPTTVTLLLVSLTLLTLARSRYGNLLNRR
jgi:hypothetical protein